MPKVFVGDSFRVSLLLVTEKVFEKEGGYQDFPPNVFCRRVPRIFVGEPFSVSLILVTEKVYEKEGGIKIFRRMFFVADCREVS